MKRLLLLSMLVSGCTQTYQMLYPEKEFNSHIGASLVYTRFTQGQLNDQKGFRAGPYFDFSWQRPWRFYGGLFFRGLWDAGHICSCDGTRVESVEYKPRMELGVPLTWHDENLNFTPFIGLGFTHLSHELVNDVITYRYHHLYVPFGFDFSYQPSDCFKMGLKTLYRFDAWTRLKVSTPDLCDTNEDKINLKRTHGVHVEMPLTSVFRSQERVSLFLACTPTFDYQKFGCVDECQPNNLQLPIAQLKHWTLGLSTRFGINF